MHNFKEYSLRKKAENFAEHITGDNLRKYVADKVKQYAGGNVSVFDGASGSGQLEQYIKPTEFIAVDIQQESITALKQNFPNAEANVLSFFEYQQKKQCDCVVMNPPFSLKMKELSQQEQIQIMQNFTWKKSGVVDDIFCLKGLQYSKRWGFFILFPGMAYRQTEKIFRNLITPQIVEFNKIKNAFDSTQIEVIFLVVDKLKNNNNTHRELVECKGNEYKIIHKDQIELNAESWEIIQEPPAETEIINPIELEFKCRNNLKKQIINELKMSRFVASIFEAELKESFNAFLNELCREIQKQNI